MYKNNEKTLTTQEYLYKKKQEELDSLFEEAIRKARAEELDLLKRQEHEKTFAKMVSEDCDLEDEIYTLQNLIFKYNTTNEKSPETIQKYRNELKTLKIRQAKLKNKIEEFIKDERLIKGKVV